MPAESSRLLAGSSTKPVSIWCKLFLALRAADRLVGTVTAGNSNPTTNDRQSTAQTRCSHDGMRLELDEGRPPAPPPARKPRSPTPRTRASDDPSTTNSKSSVRKLNWKGGLGGWTAGWGSGSLMSCLRVATKATAIVGQLGGESRRRQGFMARWMDHADADAAAAPPRPPRRHRAAAARSRGRWPAKRHPSPSPEVH